jgi:hypothetical protein
MKLGVIIRSVGERTEQLCYASAAIRVPEPDIHVIRNQYPFSEAVSQMVDIAEREQYDWYFGLDADVVLRFDWVVHVGQQLKMNNVEEYYRIDFLLHDRFVPAPVPGVHLYNGTFNGAIKAALSSTRDTNKPEGNIRHVINAPQYQTTESIGYHGFEQYRKDVFNRFALRAVRNPEYVKKHGLFQGTLGPEDCVARDGWAYGCKYKIDASTLTDARNKISLCNYMELESLDTSLAEFYRDRLDEERR